jgi:hypothetical protein
MPRIRNPYTGRMITVSSAVRVGPIGSPRQRAFCSRTAKIGGSWKRNPNSRNLVQRRRWRCGYVPGELRITEYKRRR